MSQTSTTQHWSDGQFEQLVQDAEQPVLVDFYADWCGPCRHLGPVVEELATDLHGQVVVGKINIDSDPKMAERYQVSSIPTVLLFKNGEVIERFVGVQPKQRYLDAAQALA